jgi:tetratricopeptide (TPR) repeat protein
LLERQQYADAIRLTAKRLGQNPTEQHAEEFVRSMNGGLNQADRLMQSGNLEQAAQLLKIVRRHYPSKATLQQQLTKTSAQVDKDINLSTQKMMEEGLLAYRSGDFTAAIDLWKKVIAIDPQHVAAQNSLQTTQLQLSKLKNLNSKN